jgi:bifunctional polynucleotide phosphatase/kinase
VKAFYLEVTKDLAMHNDNQRETNKHREHFSKRVGKIQIHSFFKYVEMPSTKEGFDEVRIVNFIPGPYRNELDEQSYFSFTK